MKSKYNCSIVFLVFLSIIAIFTGGNYYICSVQSALWNKTVMDILEVTDQGRHALDTYLKKDKEILHFLASELKNVNSYDSSVLQNKLQLFNENKITYICANLNTGTFNTNLHQKKFILSKIQLNVLEELQGSGIRKPFLDSHTGIWTIGIYERFNFADGIEGYVQKSQPLTKFADCFSLSFYNNTGFSYVVNQTGDILIRSQHRNSNRTFHNLFDIIDLQNNNIKEVNSFRESLKNGEKGAVRFQYQEEGYVFCYVPLKTVPDWYVVSIIPNRIIMEQANNIIQYSQILFVLILISILLIVTIFMIYQNSMHQVLQAEENARKAAESANTAKSRFLSNMSHDIRTPMNAIISMTKLAADHIDNQRKIKKYLKNIELSGQLLIGLINNILDMSKIESDKMTLNNDITSLETILTNLINIIRPMFEKKNQQFYVELHKIEHDLLFIDAVRLNQVLLNLLSNAIKFTPEGGTITLNIEECFAKCEGYTHFTFCISDTGIGMKPEFLEHIFDSFARERDSKVDKIEGSGLGMAITKMIIDMMQGNISIESQLGKGTTFTVDIDLLLPSNLQQENLTLPYMRLLIIDDNLQNYESTKKILKEIRIEADIINNNQIVIKNIITAHKQKENYSLIIFDWKFSNQDNLQRIYTIKEYSNNSIPIIISSMYSLENIETKTIEAGAVGFIQKPFFKSVLYNCIKQYVLHDNTSVENQNKKTDLSGVRILVAEDNEINQEIIQELLEDIGAQIEIAENGIVCLEKFEKSTPGYFDLILMDVHMPIMNGYEATKNIRALNRLDAATIPIIAVTANAFSEDIEAAKQAGMNSHLAKPLDIPVMLREIQRYLK
ncbi:response regulator [Fusobacterium varium]|uniref:hybrid sensor histidine kinase/response regulator n=1 Tax=Fusobacterium varium TaxID=856 RepID=UPI0035656501